MKRSELIYQVRELSHAAIEAWHQRIYDLKQQQLDDACRSMSFDGKDYSNVKVTQMSDVYAYKMEQIHCRIKSIHELSDSILNELKESEEEK